MKKLFLLVTLAMILIAGFSCHSTKYHHKRCLYNPVKEIQKLPKGGSYYQPRTNAKGEKELHRIRAEQNGIE